MSLQIAAQHLSSHGRGNDSTLVHMSPREVSSLNAIAKAHGGQLTTNPHTGLPEAGFLESILPMAAGFALNAAAPGLGTAMGGFAIPALVGGGMALMTGSLEKGLMAGLGAYGGANLGTALAEQGVQQATAAELAKDAGYAQQLEAVKQAAQTPFVPPAGADQAAINAAGDQYRANIAQLGNQAAGTYNTALDAQNTAYKALDFPGKLSQNFSTLTSPGGASGLFDKVTSSPMSLLKTVGASAAPAASEAMKPKTPQQEQADTSMGQRYAYSPGYANPMPGASATGQEQTYLTPTYQPIGDEQARKIYGFADGGATPAVNPAAPPAPTSYTAAQPSTPISTPAPAFSIPAVNSMADLVRAPESQGLVNAYLNRPAPIGVQAQYNDYLQRTLNAPPVSGANSGVRAAVANPTAASDAEYVYDANARQFVKNPVYIDPEAAAKVKKKAGWKGGPSDPRAGRFGKFDAGGSNRGYAEGGISDAHYNLGGYSDGGRLLRGPGDGVSDSIPAVIGKKQPARLADGEFVVPARIVSELGNGSTEAGARKLYAMMDRIQKARGKTVGKGKVAKNSRSEKYLPA